MSPVPDRLPFHNAHENGTIEASAGEGAMAGVEAYELLIMGGGKAGKTLAMDMARGRTARSP